MLEWRLKAYRHWLTMKEPAWANVKYPAIDYQNIIYYSAPKSKRPDLKLGRGRPELLEMYKKLGISLQEQERLAGVAVDAVFDSVPVATPRASWRKWVSFSARSQKRCRSTRNW
jgi:Fe-S cluster assembly protein SufB